MTPEFSRPIRLDAIGEAPRPIAIEADPAECAALAERFALDAVEALVAEASVARHPAGVLAEGRIRARVVQRCVATDVPLPTEIDAPFRLLFTIEPETAAGEIELSEEALDTIPIEDGAIDLGEAAAETLSLALDPYPRAPDAEAALRAAGVKSEAEAKPLGALAGLRDVLGRNGE